METTLATRGMMRAFIACIALATAAAVPAARAETVSIVDTVSGPNFQAFWKTYLIPQIKQETGIDASYTVGQGPALQLQMASWKQDHPEFSLLFVKGLDLSNMVTAKLPLEPLYPAQAKAIPNQSMEPPEFLASNNGVPLDGKGLIFWRAQFDLVYNSAFVKNPPKTWREFYDRRKEFEGHIGMIRPDAGSGGGRAFMYSFLTAFGVDFKLPLSQLQTTAAWKDAWDKFGEFSKSLAQPVASSAPVMFHQFQTEQVWLTVYAQDYSLWSAAQGQLPPTTKAAPLDVNIVGASNAWLAVPAVASAEQKEADYKVINVLLSPAVQLKMLETMYQYPGTSAWQQAPASAWDKIPPVDQAESHGIRMTNLEAITYIQQHGMDHVAQ